MACGERYEHLAVTESGYTPKNPYGAFVLVFKDYAEWKALAEKLIGFVNEHLSRLQGIELKKDPAMPQWNHAAKARATLLKNNEDLPRVQDSILMGDDEAIHLAIAVVAEALCVLDVTDAAIEGYSERAPEIPSITPAPKPPGPNLLEGFGSVLVVGAVLVAAYFVFKKGVG